jgi:glycosyltransferase involved in cell wall biosynthesis
MDNKINLKKGYTPKCFQKNYIYEGVPVTAIQLKDETSNHTFVFKLINNYIYYEVKKIIKANRFDIYHCAHPLRITSSIQAAKDSGLKVVCILTDYFFMCPLGIMLRLDNTLCDGPANGENCLRYCFSKVNSKEMEKRVSDAKKIIKYCDSLISPSEFLVKLFKHAGFIDASRFIVSRHGFDFNSIKGRRGKNRDRRFITFGYIGTIQFHKGVHVMVEAFRRVHSKNIRLKIWGECFHEVEYHKKIIEIASGDPRIEFKGRYDFNKVASLLEDIDIVIVPSIWYENAPLTISTSLAHGVPVITSSSGGMGEMVKDGENGFTFRIGDALDLSKKIQTIAQNPDMIKHLEQKVYYPIRVEEEAFNTELVYRQLLGILS